VKEALHLGMRRALTVFKSHYQKIDLEVLSEGYVDIPKKELDAIDEEVLELAKTLLAKFEEEVIPPPWIYKQCRARCPCKNLEC
jgi:hypothetical protein